MRHQPLWQEANLFPAQLDRTLVAALWPRGGCRGGNGAATANTMHFVLDPGQVVVPLQSGQGAALCIWDGQEDLDMGAVPAPQYGHVRTDSVIARVRDSAFDGGQDNDFVLIVVPGVEGTAPVLPATLGPNDYPLYEITIPGDAVNLNAATVTDCRRPMDSELAVGGMGLWGSNTLPMGCTVTWGQPISRRIYKEFFDLYGTTWGAGDGSTTVNVPNMIDRFPLGAGGVLSLGGYGGSRSINWNQMPPHTHQAHATQHAHDHASHPNTAGLMTSNQGLTAYNVQSPALYSSIFRTDAQQPGIDAWVDNAGSGSDYWPPCAGVHVIIRVL